MIDITVEQLSETYKLSVDKLLEQLKDAGIKGRSAQSVLSKEEKSKLVEYIRSKRKDSSKISVPTKRLQLVRGKITKKSDVAIEIKHKKITSEKKLVRTQVNSALLKSHQESITKSRNEEQKILAQDAQRQMLMRAQQTKEKEVEGPEITKKPNVKHTKEKPGKTVVPLQKYTYQVKDVKSNKQQHESELFTRKLKKRDKTRLAQKLREEQAKKHAFVKPVNPITYQVKIPKSIQITALAQQMNVKAGEVLKQMMSMGVIAMINDVVDQDTAVLVVEEMGHTPVTMSDDSVEDIVLSEDEVDAEQLPRPPVVTMMGHVDHGKTSLLDYIRKSKIVKSESGGITQHIGAYKINTKAGSITFLDTPGHAIFTQMRSRGANTTDIVILVVAADDGVMPETIDSIKHAKAAHVPIIVAINKMDKEDARPDKVKQVLATHDVVSDDWGGDVMMVEVSAHTGLGISALLEAIILQAEILELVAVVKAQAKGVVLEAKLDKGRGKVTTILVKSGTLNKGDMIVAGLEYGRIKQLIDDQGENISSATSAMPVEMLGLSGIPLAGDEFIVLENERKAKEIVDSRRIKSRESKLQKQHLVKMDTMIAQMEQDKTQTLNILIKADARGSVQALVGAIESLSTDEISVEIIASGVGAINDSDVSFAGASKAKVFGFNVRADAVAKKSAERDNVEIHYYSVVYHLIDDVKAMMSGLLAPEFSEEIVGLAEVKEVFKSKKMGGIAGCIVLEGSMKHTNPIRVLRENIVIYEGELESLRRFKEEVVEVVSGTECGIGVKNYNDVRIGDHIEVFKRIEKIRAL